MTTLKAPFPYMGGKSRVAREVWRRFGDAPNFVEPFFGSGAVLLGRPSFDGNRIETVNDLDGHIANFWRALQAAPDEVAYHADWPVDELSLHSRGDWLYYRPDARAWVERLRADPDYYDAKSAGWWVWFASCWIGGLPAIPETTPDGATVYGQGGGPDGVYERLPHLGDAGKGVARQLPHLGTADTGVARQASVARQRPHLGLSLIHICGGDLKPNLMSDRLELQDGRPISDYELAAILNRLRDYEMKDVGRMGDAIKEAVSYTHLDVYKRQAVSVAVGLEIAKG